MNRTGKIARQTACSGTSLRWRRPHFLFAVGFLSALLLVSMLVEAAAFG